MSESKTDLDKFEDWIRDQLPFTWPTLLYIKGWRRRQKKLKNSQSIKETVTKEEE